MASPRSIPIIPVTYDMYAGTSGSTQGDANETTPAAKANAAARSSEPAHDGLRRVDEQVR